jgi:hypothetical protein
MFDKHSIPSPRWDIRPVGRFSNRQVIGICQISWIGDRAISTIAYHLTLHSRMITKDELSYKPALLAISKPSSLIASRASCLVSGVTSG